MLNVVLAGDVGWDLYTDYRSSLSAEDVDVGRFRPSLGIDIDVLVAAGAAFGDIALRQMLPQTSLVNFDTPFFSDKFLKQGDRSESTFKDQFLCTMQEYKTPSPERSAYRIKQAKPLRRVDTTVRADGYKLFGHAKRQNTTGSPNLLVIYDGAASGSWQDHWDSASNKEQTINLLKSLNTATTGAPKILVNLNHSCPEVVFDSTGEANFKSKFWQHLETRREEVCVICSATSLRHADAIISRRLSWEQTVEDLISELRLFPPLKKLSQFRHLIVRFGISAAVSIENVEGNLKGQLIFAPSARDGIFRDPVEDGRILGNNTMLIGGIVGHLADSASRGQVIESLTDGIVQGLQWCWAGYQAGYGLDDKGEAIDPFRFSAKEITERIAKSEPATSRAYAVSQLFIERLIIGARFIKTKLDQKKTPLFFPATISRDRFERRGEGLWEIIGDRIDNGTDNSIDEKGHILSQLNLGLAITMFGVDQVLNRDWSDLAVKENAEIVKILRRPSCNLAGGSKDDYLNIQPGSTIASPDPYGRYRPEPERPMPQPIFAPVMEVEKLKSVERSIIESVRSIRNAIKEYALRSDIQPISIAVFGPPGSGKSFAVKEMAKSINATLPGDRKLEILEYNIAQFRTTEELNDALVHVASVSNEGKLPLVIFDEFDCALGSDALAWLKYFLSPMPDGKFYGAHQTVTLGSTIFVFAGGLAASFDEFNPFSETTHESASSTNLRPI